MCIKAQPSKLIKGHVLYKSGRQQYRYKTGLFLKNKYKNINIKHWQIESDEMKLHKVFFFFLNQLHITLTPRVYFQGNL